MKKVLKVFGIIIAIIIAIIVVALVATKSAANVDTYEIGENTIKSVKSVIGKRDVVAVGSAIENGITIKKYEYTSDSVFDDLVAYTEYLRTEGGFTLTKDMNLNVSPSVVEMVKEATEENEVIMLVINYNADGYEIVIQKGMGTFTKKLGKRVNGK